MLKTLALFIPSEGYNSSSAKFGQSPNEMSDGSNNMLVTGTGKLGIYKGYGNITGAASKVMMNAGDTWAGLGDYSETGIGSVFKVLGAFFYIGAGKFFLSGVDTTGTASTTLKLKKVTAGVLGTEYQAGLAKPSAPTITAITPPTGFTGKNNGVVSVKIARVRSQTGARSLASNSSNVAQCTNQSVSIVFPSADVNGQDYWEVDVTRNGEGGIGNSYFLQEIPESVIAGSVSISRVATNTTSIGIANGTLTSGNIGWQYTSSGDVTTYITAVGANDSYSAGKQAITLNVANGSTNTQSATFTRGITGAVRSFVFEWRDSDLAGADLAPSREYPPPAGIFGGVSEDVVFVDGAFGDTVDITRYARDNSLSTANTSVANPGNAIAVSDPQRPESFPPDNYIFTGDAPTCVLPGGNGVHWRFGQNSLGVIRYKGGAPALSYEKVWTGIGIQKQHNATLGAGGRLYAYTGARGAVRLGVAGEPDAQFAAQVSDDMAGWTASNVVLGYDANHQYVLFMHQLTILAFHEPSGKWCSPISDLSNGEGSSLRIRSTATVNGAAYIGMTNNSTSSVYGFNTGTSGSVGKIYTPWIPSQETSEIISRLHVAGRFDNLGAVTVKTFTNGSSSSSSNQSSTPTATGFQHLPVLKPNVRNAKSFRVYLEFTSTGGDAGFEAVKVEGESQDISF